MAPIKIKYTAGGCSFETDELEQAVAAKVLSIHSEANRVVRVPGGPQDKLQKMDRQILTTNCSQQDFGFFKEEWRRYATGSNTKDENLIRDQLLQCAEVSLRKTLQNTIRTTNKEKITVADLLLAIKKAAVEKQFDLLNKVRLMEAKQEHDKPVRIFLANALQDGILQSIQLNL